MKNIFKEGIEFLLVLTCIFVLFIALFFPICYYSAIQEAATFNKYKDPGVPEATVWDAMCSDLSTYARKDAPANLIERAD